MSFAVVVARSFRSLALLTVVAVAACQPVKLPHEVPGPAGCGVRDPRSSGPSTLSVAQNTVLKNNGQPVAVEPNDRGGRNWMFVRSSGGVFGESEVADVFVFDDKGLLVAQKSEVRKALGKM